MHIPICKYPINIFYFNTLQIWGNRPLYYGWNNNRFGFWGEVTYEDGAIVMFVYLGSTDVELFSHMRSVLSFC